MFRDILLSKKLNDIVVNKDIKWTAEPQSILQYIILFFTTERGSLPFAPNFGTNLRQLLFGNVNLPPKDIESEINAELEMLYRALPVLKQKVQIIPKVDVVAKKIKLNVIFLGYDRKDVLTFDVSENSIEFAEGGG